VQCSLCLLQVLREHLPGAQDVHAICVACRETHLAAGVLYYALTTGAGSQTLGEEYCDLLQITGLVAGSCI
jgi:Pex2 / Pex12 amino terminal region